MSIDNYLEEALLLARRARDSLERALVRVVEAKSENGELSALEVRMARVAIRSTNSFIDEIAANTWRADDDDEAEADLALDDIDDGTDDENPFTEVDDDDWSES